MTGKRKLTINFEDILDTIYDKIDSYQLQEFLDELIDDTKTDNKKIVEFEKTLTSVAQIIPGIGLTFEEFEDNVRDGTIVEIIQCVTNIFRKGLTSGDFEKHISETINNVDNIIKEQVMPKKRKF